MKRRSCPAARIIEAELAVDRALARYSRTRSQRAMVALQQARTDAMRAGRAGR
jgi:hypothetical protein